MCICSWLPKRGQWMSMSPKHGETVSFVVVPYSNYTVIASLCWGQQCCVAIKSQWRYLWRKHMDRSCKDSISVLSTLEKKSLSLLKATALKRPGTRWLAKVSYLGCCQNQLCLPTHWKLRRKHNTSQLIYLISVADEESLLVRGYLHRNDNCMTWIHHRITQFGPQSLQCNEVQRLHLYQSLK